MFKTTFKSKKKFLGIAVATAAMTLVACNDTETVTEPAESEVAAEEIVVEPAPTTEPLVEADPMDDTTVVATQSIGEMAAANEDLTILTEALQEAGLADMMMADGQYTVFAPTDDAFTALLAKLNVTKEELFSDKEMLKNVLTYHVVPMVVKSTDIPYNNDIETVNGQTFIISDANVITDASGNTANIVATDMNATNGVVHVIDTVLVPR